MIICGTKSPKAETVNPQPNGIKIEIILVTKDIDAIIISSSLLKIPEPAESISKTNLKNEINPEKLFPKPWTSIKGDPPSVTLSEYLRNSDSPAIKKSNVNALFK